MNCFVLKFKNRDARDISNKCLSEIFNDVAPKFDLELISKDENVIGAHTLVMDMFSEFIHEYLIEFNPAKNKICIPLPEFSTFVLRHVVELIYKGQIMVAAEVKPRIEAALEKMKIKGVIAINQAEQQAAAAKEAAAAAATTTKPTMLKQPTPPMVKHPITNLAEAKNVSASVPNLQQVPNGQSYKRELSANSIQYANSLQAAKRPRAQSVYIDSSSNGSGGLPFDMQKRLGGLLVNRVKVTQAPKAIPMQQMTEYDYENDSMDC